MKGAMRAILIILFFQSGLLLADANKNEGLSVVVLGSGGPMATSSGRASASYLILADGKPTILMDAGGGSYKNLARLGVSIKDLDIVLLTHLHVDHMEDLSAFIKTSYFHNRQAGTFRTHAFHIFGPAANQIPFPNTSIAQYPANSEYVDGLYNNVSGLQRYLNIFSKAISGGEFHYDAHDISANLQDPVSSIFSRDGIEIKAIAVHHGPVPALGFRIEYKGHSIVYSGDTNSSTDNMITLADKADLLIYDTAIMDDLPNGANDGVFFALHTTPSRLGEVAAQSMVKTLLLSHLTPITEPRIDQIKEIIKDQGYKGKIRVAKDLKMIKLDD